MPEYSIEKVVTLVLGLVPIIGALLRSYWERQREKRTNEKIETLESKAEQAPEKVRYAWDVARTRLERYFDRNLDQVKSIFWVSLCVMAVGFAFILYGIVRSLNDPNAIKASYVAAISGIVTEFIGMTFMLVYRSTLDQASSYMSVLERINSVGMAVQILDSIGEGHDDLKNATRAEIVKILLEGEHRSKVLPAKEGTDKKTASRRARKADATTGS